MGILETLYEDELEKLIQAYIEEANEPILEY